MSVFALTEWQWAAVPEAVAREVAARPGRAFEIAAPDPAGGAGWQIRSAGLVGYLPLAGGHALRIAPKVPIASVLAMIERAYDTDGLRWQDDVAAAATVEGLFETLAMLLCKRIGDRVRKGLYRAYVEERDELQAVRGRVLPRESLARALRGGVGLVCEFETLTDDLPDNQLVLATLARLRRFPFARDEVRRAVREQHRVLAASITPVAVRAAECLDRHYHHLNRDYRAIHVLCHLLLESCGTATEAGAAATIPFTIEMWRLFERFVARWLMADLHGWRVTPHVTFAPASGLVYSIDVVVQDREGCAVAVLDTKYKDHAQPDAADVQQVVFYATALGCREAWLVYPRPVPARAFAVRPVTVRTFGLDLARLATLSVAPFVDVLARRVASAA